MANLAQIASIVGSGEKFVYSEPPLAWNPLDYDSLRNGLTNSNRTITRTTYLTGTSFGMARVQTGKNSGKKYFEVNADYKRAYLSVGVALSSQNLVGYVGSAAQSIGLFSTGDYYTNGSNSAGTAAFTTGDRVCVAIDFALQKIWFRKNNSGWLSAIGGSQDPATGAGGIALPVSTGWGSGSTLFAAGATYQVNAGDADTLTLCGDASQFSYSAPSGFTPWGLT